MVDEVTKAFKSIKSFHGTSHENTRDWCDRAEIIFQAYNINDANRLARIAIKLEDSAFDWYRDNPGPYITWPAFRLAFEKAFPPPQRTANRHLLAEQINQRRQGSDESVHDYFYALDKLCREYDSQMSVMDKTIKLVGGLREDLKEKVLPLNLQTPEQFLIQAKNYESTQKVMENHRRENGFGELSEPTYKFDPSYPIVAASHSYRPQYPPSSQRNRNLRHDEYATPSAMPSNSQPQPIPRSVRENPVHSNNQRDSRRCFQCGHVGHIQRNCSNRLKE